MARNYQRIFLEYQNRITRKTILQIVKRYQALI